MIIDEVLVSNHVIIDEVLDSNHVIIDEVLDSNHCFLKSKEIGGCWRRIKKYNRSADVVYTTMQSVSTFFVVKKSLAFKLTKSINLLIGSDSENLKLFGDSEIKYIYLKIVTKCKQICFSNKFLRINFKLVS